MYNVLLGGCIGDALGMPFEKRIADDPFLLKWDGKSFLSSKYHKLSAGQWTDDSQMMQMVAESLIQYNGFNPDDLSQRYVDWIVSGAARGYGRTTLAAVNLLKNGTHWSESGILDSYGNGTAMRSAPFGVFYRHDLRTLVEAVKVDSAITHRSPEAEAGALAIAIATYAICNEVPDSEIVNLICAYIPNSVVLERLNNINFVVNSELSSRTVFDVYGTSADVRETVPSALYCYLKFSSFQEGVEAAIRAGGDADTTAAIVGALFGARLGLDGISQDYFGVEDFEKLLKLDEQLFNRKADCIFPRKS